MGCSILYTSADIAFPPDVVLLQSRQELNSAFLCRRSYSAELLEKVKEMAEGIVVEDAPVFKTRDEIMKKQQVVLPKPDYKNINTFKMIDSV